MRNEWLKMGSVMFPSSNRARMNGLPDLGVGRGVPVRRGLFWGQALFVHIRKTAPFVVFELPVQSPSPHSVLGIWARGACASNAS